jgi:quercetin dioxygenase-like cupin family protein
MFALWKWSRPMSKIKTRHVTPKTAQRWSNHGVEATLGLNDGEARELTFGRFVIEPNGILSAHTHTSDSIAYCVNGSCTFKIGDDCSEIFEMKPGDFVFVAAGVVHTEITGPEGVELIIARDNQGGQITVL